MELRESRTRERHAWPYVLGYPKHTCWHTYDQKDLKCTCTPWTQNFLHFSFFCLIWVWAYPLILTEVIISAIMWGSISSSSQHSSRNQSLETARMKSFWLSEVSLQFIHQQPSGPNSQDSVLPCRELGREKNRSCSPHCQLTRKAREKDISGQDVCLIRGWLLYFSAECFERKNRAALLAELYGR